MSSVRGAGLPRVARVALLDGWAAQAPAGAAWVLRGVTGSERYVEREEQEALRSQPLARPSRCDLRRR